MIDLKSLGWNEFFQNQLEPGETQHFFVGRVSNEHKTEYRVLTAQGELRARVRGRMLFEAPETLGLPTVGDWVVLSPNHEEATIERMLKRKTQFSRKVPGGASEEQIVASNVDTAFIVSALNLELNFNRVERFLTAVLESGAKPVLLFTKTDLCDDTESVEARIRTHFPQIASHLVSALFGDGLESVFAELAQGTTAVVVGPSGVGKSTLVNRLMESEVLKTGSVRNDDGKGRHTTTYRQLFVLPCGGIIIDTPGVREFQVWNIEAGLDATFSDIDALAKLCRYRDCVHESEPGCAIKAAIDEGRLDAGRLENYRKLQRENAYQLMRHDKRAVSEQRQKWKRITQAQRARYKEERRR